MSEKVFSGKTALVVGGTGGIGRGLSLALAESGASLIIHGSKAGEKSDSLAEEIFKISGKRSEIISQNLLSSSFAELESSQLLTVAKKCDILCVAFGPFVQKSLHETNISDWEMLSLYDYALPGLLLSAALPNMMKNNFGRILLFGGSGTSYRREFSTNAAYAGAKAGLNVLISSVAAEYAEYGITCNGICPGFAETEYISESNKRLLAKKTPLGQLISPSTLAEIALFLLKNADINGEILRVDGGWTPLKSLK